MLKIVVFDSFIFPNSNNKLAAYKWPACYYAYISIFTSNCTHFKGRYNLVKNLTGRLRSSVAISEGCQNTQHPK